MEIGVFGREHGVTAATDAGRRGENQDATFWTAVSGGNRVGWDGVLEREPMPDSRDDMFVAVVCDGMGGLPDGAAASSLVAGRLAEWALSCPADSLDSMIPSFADALEGAEAELMSLHPGSGTTVSAILAADGGWASAHVGDSRCYAWWDGFAWRSRDHSPVEAMFREGMISEDEMNGHPLSHIVSRHIGGGHAGSLSVSRILPGWEGLALCSDGAFGYMPPSEFGELLRSGKTAGELVDAALERGSTDNVTVVRIVARNIS
ncbi:MAG: serine/threonine-protein phosphatase [Thermoplasmata archaeon]|nr:serine/threonine-protein phosphatase [Thermoplasmata archaeon]